MVLMDNSESLFEAIKEIPDYQVCGRVSSVQDMLVKCSGINNFVSIGSRCMIENRYGKSILSEVISVDDRHVLLMPFKDTYGVGAGCKVTMKQDCYFINPDNSWRGRVINSLGMPIDGKGSLKYGPKQYMIKAAAPPAHSRKRVGQKIDLGIKSLNTFLTCCEGQRMGIFAGSGVGKSVLMSMLTKYCTADVKVIGLIGERGREVQEFIQDYLGEEGLKNAVIIVATGDESALMRKYAAYMTITVAEYFSDQGLKVLCMMDSITRLAMAQREIGLAANEPPTTKGYTPSVFSELPKVLERAGPSIGKGSITGLFTVLVEGSDMEEPIADAVRGMLDGHIVLDRKIAERGRFPAVDILRSVSRTMPGCNSDYEINIIKKAREMVSTYNDMEDMVLLGAYKAGTDKKVDESIKYYPQIEKFLSQNIKERVSLDDGYRSLAAILGINK